MKIVRITLFGCLAAVWLVACGQDSVAPPSPDPYEELGGDHPRSIDIELYKVLGKNPLNATEAELARVTHLQLVPGPHYSIIDQYEVDLLAACVNLVELEIESMDVSNEHLVALAGLTKLERLNLLGNHITDLSPLAGLVQLDSLYLPSNQIVDLSPLVGLVQLERLSLRRNKIVDIQSLLDNIGIGAGDVIQLQENQLSDISRNQHIPALEARGVTVWQ